MANTEHLNTHLHIIQILKLIILIHFEYTFYVGSVLMLLVDWEEKKQELWKKFQKSH